MLDVAPDPLISVVIEGYNDSIDLGSALETVGCLEKQRYPLERIEVILVGSKKQAEYWGKRLVGNRPGGKRGFLRIEAVGADGAHYYQLKNLGVQHSTGEIVAFIDSDALPNADWLRRIATGITSGAAVVAGITLFRWENGSRRFAGFLTAAASISWGFIVGDPPRGFLSHNAAFRRVDFERIRYREDLGRTCAGSFLHESLIQQELPIRFQPEQRVYHAFNFRWWITRLHVRFGHEVHLLRRLNPQARHRWVRRLGPLEPLASMAWHMALDLPQWFRFSKALGWSVPARIAYVPVVLPLSLAARGAEAVGMYATLFSPRRMRLFALSN